jgi:hypothetical protein
MIAILGYAYLIVLLICAILSLKTFRLRWPLAYKIFSIVLWVELLTDFTSEAYFRYKYYYLEDENTNNHWIMTIGVIIQTLLYGLTYIAINESKPIKRYIYAIMVLFTGFALYNFIWAQGFFNINSHTHVAGSILVISCIFLYAENMRKQSDLNDILKIPFTWICLALFAFHLLNIPIMININYLNSNHGPLAQSFMYVYKIIILFSNLLILKAFLCPQPQQK